MPYIGFMVSSKTKVLTVRLPNDMADKIIDIAKRCKTPPSQLMVHMLDEFLRRHGHYKEEKPK